MSVTTEEDKTIEDEAYAVIESTNDDGSVDAEVTSEPERDGDEVVFDVLPLIPTHDSKEVRMDWPVKESEEYDIVKLCNKKVGGFQSISNLKDEKVKVDMKNDDSGDFDIVIDNKEEISGININKNILSYVIGLSAILSLVGLVTPVVLLFLIPWNVFVLSFFQGVSMFIGSGILLIVLVFTYEAINNGI